MKVSKTVLVLTAIIGLTRLGIFAMGSVAYTPEEVPQYGMLVI